MGGERLGTRLRLASRVKLGLVRVAWVTNVSVGLSAGLKNFSLLAARKLGRVQTSARKGSVPLVPIFAPPKSGKTYGNACYAG